MPEYQGGDAKLINFIKKNLIYPETLKNKNTQGHVIVGVVVNTMGRIEKAEVIKSLSPECDKEALRVINLTKNWIPGKQNGVPVSVRFAMPIRFINTSGNKSIPNSLNTTN